MMADLIDRQTAYDVLTEFYHHTTDIQHMALHEALNRVPVQRGLNKMINLEYKDMKEPSQVSQTYNHLIFSINE